MARGASGLHGMARGPFSNFRFQVRFSPDVTPPRTGADNSVADAGFADVIGLEANVELTPVQEGGRWVGVRQLVGRTTHPNLTFKRGLTSNLELWRWFTNVSRGVHPVARKSIVIELLDVDITVAPPNNVVARWTAVRAVPVKMRCSDLSGKGGTELAIEELQVAHEGIEIDLSVGAQG